MGINSAFKGLKGQQHKKKCSKKAPKIFDNKYIIHLKPTGYMMHQQV